MSMQATLAADRSAGEGLNALFTPDFAALADPDVWIAAYSQIFFSLSIAFGIMVTYASYRRRRSNLTTPGLVVAFANSSFEILAGIGVFATLGFFAFEQGARLERRRRVEQPHVEADHVCQHDVLAAAV